MSAVEIERLLALFDDSRTRSREEVVRYVEEHRAQILEELQRTGKSIIPGADGEDIVLRAA
jgi:hypothetical protein